MFRTVLQQLKPSLCMLFWMTLLTGLAYPLAMAGAGKALFPEQAEGSLVRQGEAVVGSSLIGQQFVSERYFQGRPSATSPSPDNASASSGSNLGPSNQALADGVKERAAQLATANGQGPVPPVPMDLATASASGLDPHISPEAAYWQAARVAKARGLDPGSVSALIEKHVEGRLLGFWGEPRVNVLALNLALDEMSGPR
jgi:K+-transporting ATPase ATPase C chain